MGGVTGITQWRAPSTPAVSLAAAIKGVLADRQLQVATRGLPHCIPGLFTIDHIAVPKAGQIVDVTRIVAEGLRGNRLSDHDACAAEIATS